MTLSHLYGETHISTHKFSIACIQKDQSQQKYSTFKALSDIHNPNNTEQSLCLNTNYTKLVVKIQQSMLQASDMNLHEAGSIIS